MPACASHLTMWEASRQRVFQRGRQGQLILEEAERPMNSRQRGRSKAASLRLPMGFRAVRAPRTWLHGPKAGGKVLLCSSREHNASRSPRLSLPLPLPRPAQPQSSSSILTSRPDHIPSPPSRGTEGWLSPGKPYCPQLEHKGLLLWQRNNRKEARTGLGGGRLHPFLTPPTPAAPS